MRLFAFYHHTSICSHIIIGVSRQTTNEAMTKTKICSWCRCVVKNYIIQQSNMIDSELFTESNFTTVYFLEKLKNTQKNQHATVLLQLLFSILQSWTQWQGNNLAFLLSPVCWAEERCHRISFLAHGCKKRKMFVTFLNEKHFKINLKHF